MSNITPIVLHLSVTKWILDQMNMRPNGNKTKSLLDQMFQFRESTLIRIDLDLCCRGFTEKPK